MSKETFNMSTEDVAADLSLSDLIILICNKISIDYLPTAYIFSFFEESATYHIVIEIILILILLQVWFTPRQKTKLDADKLNEREIEQMVEEFLPIPLVSLDRPVNDVVVFESPLTAKAIVNKKTVVNAGTFDYLGFVHDKDVRDACIKVIEKYGVGACGPRGFYGTIDVHVFLEEEIAKFMGTQEAIIYSYGFATIASAIPPYSKRQDIIFCDTGVSFATQTGLLASRSRLIWFRHNDMKHLETLMEQQRIEDEKKPEKALHIKRLIVVEGLYTNYGDICPLPEVIALKKKYKARIFLEESNSFGVLGKTGKGVTEHFGVDVADVDQICASMENALGAVGGFCAGSNFVIDHQRLAGKGYCFSASLPPFNCEAARVALAKLKEDPNRLQLLHKNIVTLKGLISGDDMKLKVTGGVESPIFHIRLPVSDDVSHDIQREILEGVVEKCLANGLAVHMSEYIVSKERHIIQPSIRVTISALHTDSDLATIARELINASKDITIPK